MEENNRDHLTGHVFNNVYFCVFNISLMTVLIFIGARNSVRRKNERVAANFALFTCRTGCQTFRLFCGE